MAIAYLPQANTISRLLSFQATMRLAPCLLAFQASSTFFSTTAVRALTTTSSMSTKNLVVDRFCFRQFQEHPQSQTYGGTVFSQSVEAFEEVVNGRFKVEDLKDGYAPFCKHIFLVNDFTGSDARVRKMRKSKLYVRCGRSIMLVTNIRNTRSFTHTIVRSMSSP